MVKQNVNYTTYYGLCTGCGICADVCIKNAISIKAKNGVYKPLVDVAKCIDCGKCLKACPGIGVNIKSIADETFSREAEYNNKVGYYYSSYYGYAKDEGTRWHGASGGMTTAFIAFLLDRKYITAAVVAENDLSQDFLNKTSLIRESKELYKARSSKYCPVKFDGIVSQIKKEKGKVVIVGLPCVIQGYRKYEKIDRDFSSRIFGYVGLYCSCGRSFNLTEYVFKQNKIDKETLSYFQYRDEGCLGSMVAIDKSGGKKIPYQLYYHPLRSFFIPNRCLFCIDHFAELADISFGDIHVGEFKKDTIGLNSVVVRNTQFDNLLQQASNDGYITLEKLSKEDLIGCQKSINLKKGRVGGVMVFCKLLGVRLPQYDVEVNAYSFVKSALYYIFAKSQMFVGNRQRLWPLISLFAPKGKIQ